MWKKLFPLILASCFFSPQAAADAGPSPAHAACPQLSVPGRVWSLAASRHQPLPTDVSSKITLLQLFATLCASWAIKYYFELSLVKNHFSQLISHDIKLACVYKRVCISVCVFLGKFAQRAIHVLAESCFLLIIFSHFTDQGCSPWAGNCHGNRL